MAESSRSLICSNGHTWAGLAGLERSCPECGADGRPVDDCDPDVPAVSESAPKHGLWSLMQRSERAALADSRSDLTEAEPPLSSASAETPSDPALSSPAETVSVDSSRKEPHRLRRDSEFQRRLWYRRCVLAISLAALSLPLSLLTLRENVWLGGPAAVAGLLALLLASITQSDLRRLKIGGIWRWLPAVAMVAGVTGIFAGPLWLNPIGERQRLQAVRDGTRQRLKTIGEALNAFHDRHGHFPAGSKTVIARSGSETPLHSWMTALLPFVGEEALAVRIDPNKAWDDPVHEAVMTQPVQAFQIPGLAHEPSLRGFASTRFSGVGGPEALFNRNVEVQREQIRDGLSQTLAAGEISRLLPAWGEPDNWRQIGIGLNQEASGFGNSAGTGAHFLMMDGSVRFFSNRTTPEVLRRMSTLSGDD